MAVSKTQLHTIIRSASLFLGLLVLFVAGTLLHDQFLTIDNQRDVLWQVSGNGILAVGMTLVILTAGIDLSVGSILSVGTVVCAMLLMEREVNHASDFAIPCFALVVGGLVAGAFGKLAPPALRGRARTGASLGLGAVALVIAAAWALSCVSHGFGVVGVLLLVPPVGLVLGAVSGTIIAKGKLQPFIVTLAMMVSAVGFAKFIAGYGGQVHPIYFGDAATEAVAPAAFESLAENIPVLGKDLIPVPGIFFAVCAVVAALLLAKTRTGRYIYAVGGNEETARLSGINTDRVKIFVYAASGLLSALAGVLYCAQYQQGKADAGFTRELDAIAAVVIGGTSLMGGRGGIGGTVVGVFIFGYLSNIMNLLGISTEFQDVFKGLIIVLAVLLQEGVLVRWIRAAFSWIRDTFAKPATS
jgi:simple sugar transport system permease protein